VIPRKYFIVKGMGRGSNEIEAFEMALRNAGIEKLNLVPVSSILPKDAVKISPEEGMKKLVAGQIAFCVMAKKIFNKGKGSVAIGVAYGNSEHGYFVEIEREDFGAGQEAFDTARRLFVSKFGKEPSEVFAESVEAEARGTTTCILVCAVLL